MDNKEIKKNVTDKNIKESLNNNIDKFTHLNPLEAQKMAHTYSLLVNKNNYKRKGTFFEKTT